MSRKSTARKLASLDEAAINCEKFARSFPFFRADQEPAAASKQVVRLLFAFTFLWLPVHAGVCWLATKSLGLVAVAVLFRSTPELTHATSSREFRS